MTGVNDLSDATASARFFATPTAVVNHSEISCDSIVARGCRMRPAPNDLYDILRDRSASSLESGHHRVGIEQREEASKATAV
jgi:hypothetical protein